MIIDISEDGYAIEWTSMVTGERKNASIVQLIDAFEVEPIRQARWKGAGMGDYMCSLCNEVVTGNRYHYCPNCGAKMHGGENG